MKAAASDRESRVNFASISCAKSCMVLRKTQRASSEVADLQTTAPASDELKILVSAVQFRPWPPTISPRSAVLADRGKI
jgi:hypothetical protein